MALHGGHHEAVKYNIFFPGNSFCLLKASSFFNISKFEKDLVTLRDVRVQVFPTR
jgi:hypothetical protein